ncbi:MAG: extracellular solute-binding protein, partial [Spirochaetaceae bacterium]|nr:extracellular solute-binding protein [Spirochaetaceae bacterium]
FPKEGRMGLSRVFRLAVALLMAGSAPLALAQELSLLQWSHFVPRYDKWFDAWAEDWGEANGFTVRVDHVNVAELPAALTAAIEAGEGPSIIEMVFPPTAFIEGLHPLNDVNEAAAAAHGERTANCQATSYLPINDTYVGFTHGYIPDPGDYQISLWADVGMPDGPSTWDELYEGGLAVYRKHGVPVGIGLSPELDSRMATRAVIWSHGGSVQDADENVVLNSTETIAAVEYYARLQNDAMTDEVFGWTASSNNQGLIAGELSYILNSISAYRSLQKIDEEAAADIGFVPALAGPAGAFASSHVWQIYVIPTYVQGAELEAAKKFILDHTAAYSDAVYNSELYNFPCYPSTVPELSGWLADDPFGSQPADKLKVLETVNEWSVYIGYPGTANPAVMQAFGENLVVNMVARVAKGEQSAEESVAEAHARAEEIFADWRARGYLR